MFLTYDTDTKEYRFLCAKHAPVNVPDRVIVTPVQQEDVADTFNPNTCEACGKRKSYGAF